MKEKRARLSAAAAAVPAAALLYLFYVKYVPLVSGFQTVLLPILAAAFFLAAFRPRAGLLFFLFALPLTNSLPYFYGIHENIPHAPTALVLFLFAGLGWLVRRALGRDGTAPAARTVLHGPLALVAGLVLLSALITYLRFLNFYPFLSAGVYELASNVNGVTAGGARMSILFNSLNILAGFAFFVFVLREVRARSRSGDILTALLGGLALATLFGLLQHFVNPALGTTPFWVKMGQVNGTFKDPNAFAGFLAMFFPLALGSAFTFRGGRRVIAAAAALLGLLVFPFIGNRSGVLGLAVSLSVFFLLSLISRPGSLAAARSFLRKPAALAAVSAAVLGIVAFVVLGPRQARLFERLAGNVRILARGGGLAALSPERYHLWKQAAAMIRDYPLTGVGIGAYIIELPNYYTLGEADSLPGFEGVRPDDSAENFFLQIAAEMGLPAAVAFLWIFIFIARKIVRGLRESRAGGPDFLLIGASAGVAAHFISLLFHSYIGSFEVAFGFWLLSALLFLPAAEAESGRTENVPASPRPGWKGGAAALLGLAIFSAIHLGNSLGSLSLASRTEIFAIRQEFGLFPPETDNQGRVFRWTGREALLALESEKPVIRLHVLASHPDIENRPVRVDAFLVEGFFRRLRPLAGMTLQDKTWQEMKLALPEAADREVLILVRVSRTWNPRAETGVPDPRNLGVAISFAAGD